MYRRHKTSTSRGFTLVELLVVIAIIGILVSLLLPAVQSAREAARRAQCQDHLKQVAVGWLNHESAHKSFPSGGWSPWVVGDPDMGVGSRQPGGWMFQILPYIEQQALYNLAGDGDATVITAQQKKASLLQQATPVTVFNCPSRRPPLIMSFTLEQPLWTPKNSDPVQQVVCGDYAANGGDNARGMSYQLEGQYTEETDDDKWVVFPNGAKWVFLPFKGYPWGNKTTVSDWPPIDSQSGVNFTGSEIEFQHIEDGSSNVYMVGEKNLDPDCYFGEDTNDLNEKGEKGSLGSGGDGHSYFQGFDWDTHRFAYKPPVQDSPGADLYELFGSAHPATWHATFCDGAVRAISYDIDLTTHKRLANRYDGRTIGSY